MKFATKAIHMGQLPDKTTGSVMPPIYMSSTFVQESPGVSKGYEYTRANNPNFSNLEAQVASLEEAEYATVFSSGLGALTAILVATLVPGDEAVAIGSLYGGTYRLFNQVFNRFGVKFKSCNPTTAEGHGQLLHFLKEKPKWLFFESPTNPLMEIFDLEKYAKLAHEHGALCIVDNTFASPYCQNPLKWGVDVVWHSSTKYLGGHSDVIGGVVVTNRADLKEKLDFLRKSLGSNPSPFDCWLVSRGIKTLSVRMEQHQRNALAIAQFLEGHAKVKKVHYPGLRSHPSHEIAKKQMRGFSGMLSAEFHLSLEATKRMISDFHLFSLAESLGGVESLVNHPASMTHATVPSADRLKLGLSDSLVRFSIGIEDAEDLIEDLKIALEKA